MEKVRQSPHQDQLHSSSIIKICCSSNQLEDLYMSKLVSLVNKNGIKLFVLGSITLVILVLITAKTDMIFNLKWSPNELEVMIDSRSTQ